MTGGGTVPVVAWRPAITAVETPAVIRDRPQAPAMRRRQRGSVAAVRVAAGAFESHAEMLAERFDRFAVLDIGVAVGHADDNRAKRAVILAAGRQHRGRERVPFVVA